MRTGETRPGGDKESDLGHEDAEEEERLAVLAENAEEGREVTSGQNLDHRIEGELREEACPEEVARDEGSRDGHEGTDYGRVKVGKG